MDQFTKTLKRAISASDWGHLESQALLRLSKWAYSTIGNGLTDSWSRNEILQALAEFGTENPELELYDWLTKGIFVPSPQAKHRLCFCNPTVRFILAAYHIKNSGPELFPQIIDWSADSPWDEVLCCLNQLLEQPDDLFTNFLPSEKENVSDEMIRIVKLGRRFLQMCHYIQPNVRQEFEMQLGYFEKEWQISYDENSFFNIHYQLPLELLNGLELANVDFYVLHKELLTDSFSETELRNLCAYLDIDYANLPTQGGKEDKARELILYLNQRKKLGRLFEEGIRMRNDINWKKAIRT